MCRPSGARLALAALLLGAGAGVAAAQSAGSSSMRARLDRMIRDTTLANGLTVIVAENHVAPVTTAEIVVRTGAFTQDPGDEGISHLFEHVLFRAYGPEQAFQMDVARINGLYNGTTSAEAVTYYITAPSEHSERATKILSALVTDPSFRRGDVDAEIRIVVGEYERSASDPAHQLHLAVERSLWGAGVSRKDPLGEPPTIQALTPKRLKEVYQRYYVPNNAALIITGDVRTDDALRWAVKHFAKWKAGPDPFAASPIPPIPALAAPATVVIPADVNQVTVRVAWHGPSARASVRDSWIADVFGDIVNSPIAPLGDRLVSSGLFQSVGVGYYTQANTGPITIGGVTSHDRAVDALAALRAEIARFDDPDYFTAEMLEIARKRRRVGTEFGLERGSGIAHSLAFWWSVTDLDYFRGYGDGLQTVTLDELRDWVSRYIIGKPFVAAALVPNGYETPVGGAMDRHFGQGVIR